MHWPQIITVSVVQGLTEFLPISSSAHLIVLPHLVGWPDQGIAFDMATNVGTLAAVVIYFARDVWRLLCAGSRSLMTRRMDDDARLAWGIVVASIPVLVLGLVVGLIGEDVLRRPWIVAWASIVFGIALAVADRRAAAHQTIASLGWRRYVGIGLAQAVALIPGASRSGMSMFGALWAGLDRREAARLAFFLAIPVTSAAILFEALKLVDEPSHVAWSILGIAALLSGVTAMIAIHFFLRLIQAVGMMPFVVYRVVLGVFLLAYFGLG